jgi:hypothetical protein
MNVHQAIKEAHIVIPTVVEGAGKCSEEQEEREGEETHSEDLRTMRWEGDRPT